VDVVDVTERLMSEFDNQLGLDLITRVVTQCRHDLHGAPPVPCPNSSSGPPVSGCSHCSTHHP